MPAVTKRNTLISLSSSIFFKINQKTQKTFTVEKMEPQNASEMILTISMTTKYRLEQHLTSQIGRLSQTAWLASNTNLSSYRDIRQRLQCDIRIAQNSKPLPRMRKVLPGNTKMKQAANPPISEITRPISGMKRARTRVTTNHTSVCRILLLLSRRTHTSTCSPWKRSHSPSITALEGMHSDEMLLWLPLCPNVRSHPFWIVLASTHHYTTASLAHNGSFRSVWSKISLTMLTAVTVCWTEKCSSSYLPQKCKMGYEVMTQMTIKALAKATAMSLGGYDIKTSWLTLEPNVRKPQTPDKTQNTTTASHDQLTCAIS